ncbi:MAG: hypothetical protein HYS80_02715 [Candidatus Aenigmarchaeota archaeon]|nr:hypothetical protein [Candidatus Aenigmarchaeota archaeon]
MKTVAPNSADFIQSILYSLGGEPVTRGPAGDVWHYGPREITFDPTGKIASAKLPNVGMGSYAFPALGLAAVGYTFLEGLSTGGLIQGVRNVALDVAVSGAVSKYAHSVHNGEFYYGKIGKGFNPLTETLNLVQVWLD